MIREVAGKLIVSLWKPLKGSEGPSPNSAEHMSVWVLKLKGPQLPTLVGWVAKEENVKEICCWLPWYNTILANQHVQFIGGREYAFEILL